MKPWIETYSGQKFMPFISNEEDECGEIRIEDIAHSLALQCRFNGHCSRFYSVAEHSVNVSKAVYAITLNPVFAMQGLLHDGGETYLGDVPTPIKNFLYVIPDDEIEDRFSEYETWLLERIFKVFNLPWPMVDVVRIVDSRILADEREELLPNGKHNVWKNEMAPLNIPIRGQHWTTAKSLFLFEFDKLKRLIAEHDARTAAQV